jgi:SpoVK/Ycf46/Vps4 family AAA+-type ATPase
MHETKLPNPASKKLWDELVGLDENKALLLDTLELLLEPTRIVEWQRQHHRRPLRLAAFVERTWPLVLLKGDVGCGKSAVATSVGDPLARRLDSPVVLVEAPAGIRGSGLVGEMSTRISETFRSARDKTPKRGHLLLVLDEGDDIGTSREQLQAHHEDRAGVNALIKELDRLAAEPSRVVVLLITNRGGALDPALLRRAALSLHFDRPRGPALTAIWKSLLDGLELRAKDLDNIVRKSQREVPYTFSDLVHRVGRAAVLRAYREARPVSVDDVVHVLQEIEPTPPFRDDTRFLEPS